MKKIAVLVLGVVILLSFVGCGYKNEIVTLEANIMELEKKIDDHGDSKKELNEENKDLETDIKAFEEENSKLEEEKLAREATVKELEVAVEKANDKGLGIMPEALTSNFFYLKERLPSFSSMKVDTFPEKTVSSNGTVTYESCILTDDNYNKIITLKYTMVGNNKYIKKIVLSQNIVNNEEYDDCYAQHYVAILISLVMLKEGDFEVNDGHFDILKKLMDGENYYSNLRVQVYDSDEKSTLTIRTLD